MTIIPTPCGKSFRLHRADLRELICSESNRCPDCQPLGSRLAGALDGEQGGRWFDYLAANLALASLLCSAARARTGSWALSRITDSR